MINYGSRVLCAVCCADCKYVKCRKNRIMKNKKLLYLEICLHLSMLLLITSFLAPNFVPGHHFDVGSIYVILLS